MSDSRPELVRQAEDDPLLTPSQVGAVFAVDAKTVVRWSDRGLIEAVWTLGRRRRFRESDVRALFEQAQQRGRVKP